MLMVYLLSNSWLLCKWWRILHKWSKEAQSCPKNHNIVAHISVHNAELHGCYKVQFDYMVWALLCSTYLYQLKLYYFICRSRNYYILIYHITIEIQTFMFLPSAKMIAFLCCLYSLIVEKATYPLQHQQQFSVCEPNLMKLFYCLYLEVTSTMKTGNSHKSEKVSQIFIMHNIP